MAAWRTLLALATALLTMAGCAVPGSAATGSPQTGNAGDVGTAPDLDRPLTGATWMLDGIVDGGSVSSPPEGISATMRIAGGRIHYFDGLNDSDGPVDPDGQLVIGPNTVQIRGQIGTSAVGCADGHICSVDMSVLTHDFHYRISGNNLTVTGMESSAGNGLTFVSRDHPPAVTTGSAAATPAPPTDPGSPFPETSAGPP